MRRIAGLVLLLATSRGVGEDAIDIQATVRGPDGDERRLTHRVRNRDLRAPRFAMENVADESHRIVGVLRVLRQVAPGVAGSGAADSWLAELSNWTIWNESSGRMCVRAQRVAFSACSSGRPDMLPETSIV